MLGPVAKGVDRKKLCPISRPKQDDAVSEQFASSWGQFDLDYADSEEVTVQEFPIQKLSVAVIVMVEVGSWVIEVGESQGY